jgi:hypothetical protein
VSEMQNWYPGIYNEYFENMRINSGSVNMPDLVIKIDADRPAPDKKILFERLEYYLDFFKRNHFVVSLTGGLKKNIYYINLELPKETLETYMEKLEFQHRLIRYNLHKKYKKSEQQEFEPVRSRVRLEVIKIYISHI